MILVSSNYPFNFTQYSATLNIFATILTSLKCPTIVFVHFYYQRIVIWGYFCSWNLQWCSSTVICTSVCCVCTCRHTHMHIIYLWWTSSGTSQYKSLFYNFLWVNAIQANFHFRDFSCADNFKFQLFFFNCSQEGGCGRNEYFVFTEKTPKAVSLENTGTFIL